jgi:hypothetical protein
LDQKLPSAYHQQIFVLALGDVAVDNNVVRYSDEDYRAQLDGLTYNGLIDLADRSGAPVKQQYYSGRRGYRQVQEEQWHQQRIAQKTAPYFPPPRDDRERWSQNGSRP